MTRTNESVCRPLNNERGQSLALVGIGFGTLAFLGLAVVAVDVGRLAFTATEVQTLADSTAMAAAIALMNGVSETTAANTVAGLNKADGATAVVPCGGSPCADLTRGNIDATTWAFTAGALPTNAVMSTAQTTVNNILASILGASTTTVTKTAIGAFGGQGSGVPNLPIALCGCAYPANCNTPSCVEPTFTIPAGGTAGWTGFTSGHSDSTIKSFVPAACDNQGGATPPNLTTGNSVDTTNGAGPGVFADVRCMVCTLGMCTAAAPCTVPVIDCGSCPPAPINGNMRVIGFASVTFSSSTPDEFRCTGSGGVNCPCGAASPGSVQGMHFQSIFFVDGPGTPGGGAFGTIVAGMVG